MLAALTLILTSECIASSIFIGLYFLFKLLPLVSSLVPLVCWFDLMADTVENSQVESFLLILVVA